jgi:hypothetical protein
MKLEDLTKYKHKNKIGAIIIIMAILGVAYFGGLGAQSMYDVSDIDIKTHTGIIVNDGDTILESEELYLDIFDISINDLAQCNLYLAVDSRLVSTGVYSEIDGGQGYDHRWNFDLSDVYKSTHMYYLGTVEADPWNSYGFYIVGDEDSPSLGVEVLPELISKQLDKSVQAGVSIRLTWEIEYNRPGVVEFYLDGTLVKTVDHSGIDPIMIYDYIFTSVVIDDFVVEFKFIPDSAAVALISDEAVITVYAESDTTPTTDTNTTTTDTTTGVTPPVEPAPDYTLFIVGVIAVVIVGFVILKKRSEY